jgi:hypothetical protein
MQTATTRYMYRTMPGHIYTPEGPGRETESLEIPYTLQTFTFTVAGTIFAVAGDYVITVVTPNNGTIPVTYTATGAETHTQLATAIAAAINAKAGVGATLLRATSAVGVVTAIVNSANVSIATPTTAVPGGTTLTAAQSVATAATALRIGLWYVHGTASFTGSITATPRAARIAALPTVATVIADLRGVVARTANQTTQAAAYADRATPDAYPAGSVAYGCLRGEVGCIIDPASASMSTWTSQVHVVIAAGAYSVVGSVVAAADGGNTIRMDNVVPVRARVGAFEETVNIGGTTYRCCNLKVNQTN